MTGRAPLTSVPAGTWAGAPVTLHRGAWRELEQLVPRFERREFRLGAGTLYPSELNAGADVIVRVDAEGDSYYPIAVVSKQYALVQHHEVFGEVVEAVGSIAGEEGVEYSLRLTPNGERMSVTALMPPTVPFSYALASDDHMRFRIECFNSVDRSTTFMLTWGWFRLICQNGLMTGRVLGYDRRAHRGNLDVASIRRRIRESVPAARADASRWDQWRRTRIAAGALPKWVDGPLAKEWGPKAAARVWNVCTTGRDAEFRAAVDSGPPTQRSVTLGKVVPGSATPALTYFDVAQAMSWVAGTREEAGKRLTRIGQIPKLVARLKGTARPLEPRQRQLAL